MDETTLGFTDICLQREKRRVTSERGVCVCVRVCARVVGSRSLPKACGFVATCLFFLCAHGSVTCLLTATANLGDAKSEIFAGREEKKNTVRKRRGATDKTDSRSGRVGPRQPVSWEICVRKPSCLRRQSSFALCMLTESPKTGNGLRYVAVVSTAAPAT